MNARSSDRSNLHLRTTPTSRTHLHARCAKPQPCWSQSPTRIAGHPLSRNGADESHCWTQTFIDFIQRPSPNVGISHRRESSAHSSFANISGRICKPTTSDSLPTAPFSHPPVRSRIASKHRSRDHFRLGDHRCGPPLSLQSPQFGFNFNVQT